MSTSIKFRGKYVGRVIDETYHTNRDETTLFTKYNSVNISVKVLDVAKEEGATKVSITLKLNGKEEVFEKKIADIEEDCKIRTYDKDPQYILSLEYLRTQKRRGGRSMTLAECGFIQEIKEAN